ncbi:hypothetical protein [Actinoallomurus acanthiterrae]
MRDAAVPRDLRGDVCGRATGQDLGEQLAGAQRPGEVHDPSDASGIDVLEGHIAGHPGFINGMLAFECFHDILPNRWILT